MCIKYFGGNVYLKNYNISNHYHGNKLSSNSIKLVELIK